MAASRVLELIVKARDEGVAKAMTAMGSAVEDVQFRLNMLGTAYDIAADKAKSFLSGTVSAMFSLKGVLAQLGVGLLAKSFIDAASETEGYRVQLRILTGDVERGNQLFKEAAEYASKVTYEYRDIMGVVTQLRGVIKGSDQDVMQWVRLTGDVAAAAGLDIRTATEQITRMYSAGAQAAELFKERGKLAMLGFQCHTWRGSRAGQHLDRTAEHDL
jgi:phage tail tape-measure protein